MIGADSSQTLSRDFIVAEARRWIGTPYIHQASVLGAGCDCLGLVRGVWRALIGPEPEQPGPYSPDWAEATGEERLLTAAQRYLHQCSTPDFRAGDVLMFRWRPGLPAKHLGIATTLTTMVHAHDGANVCETPIAKAWRNRLAFVFSFPGVDAG